MRLYTFSHFMLSSIQQGIQPAHVISELFVKYPNELHNHDTPDYKLYDWAKNHKTIICLNGGNNQNLTELYHNLSKIGERLGLPHCKFHEDEESLGGVMTCCGIVVPEKNYEQAVEIRESPRSVFDVFVGSSLPPDELALAMLINSCGLAK